MSLRADMITSSGNSIMRLQHVQQFMQCSIVKPMLQIISVNTIRAWLGTAIACLHASVFGKSSSHQIQTSRD